MTVSLPRWRCSSPRPRLGRAGSGRLGRGRVAAGRRKPRSSSSSRAAAAAASARRGFGGAARFFLGGARACSAAALLGLAVFFGAAALVLALRDLRRAPRGGALPRARPGALPRPRAAGCVCSSLRRGDLVLRPRAAARRGAAQRACGAGLGASATGSGLGASARRRFARAAEDAALLDLDDDRVRAAVAEALLDLAGLDRALEAQRRPGAKLRFFGLVCHSIPSSNLLQPSRSSRRVLRLPDHDRGQ